MQQLHLVGFTTDLEGLIFSARKGAKSGGYLVMLDDRLQATIEDALRLRNGDDDALDDGDTGTPSRPRRPKPQSTLSPREIQARLRTGSSIAEVADEAGVDEEWVGRFAAPILAEQAQVVARARRLTFEKPRLGASALPLGEAVRWNLADRDIRFLDDDFDAAWNAYNLQGTSWVVRFQYASRGKRQTAEWEVDLRENELMARNRVASDLGYIDGTRRRRRPPVLEPSPRETPATAAAARREVPPPAAPTVASAPRLPMAAVAGRGAAKAGAGTGGKAGRAVATKSSSGRRGGAAATRTGAARAGATRAAGKAGKAAARSSSAAAKATKGTASTAKASAPRRAAAAKKAAKATKATGARRATATKRGRATTKAAGKKPGPDHRAVALPAVPAPAAPLDIAVRRSHLARPASPMKSANTAVPRAAEDGFRVLGRETADGRVRLPAPRPDAVERRRPPALDRAVPPPVAEAPVRRAPAPPAPAPESVARRRPVDEQPPSGPAGDGAAGNRPRAAPSATPTPEERLARRLAGRQNGGDGSRSRRARQPAATGEAEEPEESLEPLWHGPGSGEPAPAVRIRADMAAATVRPHEAREAGGPPAAPDAAPVRRRRERPLRAR